MWKMNPKINVDISDEESPKEPVLPEITSEISRGEILEKIQKLAVYIDRAEKILKKQQMKFTKK